MFEDYLDDVHHKKRRKGLADPVHPNAPVSSEAVSAAMAEATGAVPIPFNADDYIDLMPVKNLCIQPNGITCLRRTYDSAELFPFRREVSPETHTKKWRVRFNPYDPFAVWIKDPRDGSWIECIWTQADALTEPFSAPVRAESRRIAEERGVLGDEEAVEETMRIISRGKEEQNRLKRMASRSAAALGSDERSGLQVPRPREKGHQHRDGKDKSEAPAQQSEDMERFDPGRDLI
jgi:putative transposase